MKRAWALLSIVPILVGVIPILSWLTGINFLVHISSTYLPYALNPAVCFIFAGVALFLTTQNTELSERLQMGLGFAIVVIATLTLLQDIFAVNFHIDNIIKFTVKSDYNTVLPGRMAPNTSLAFIAAGLIFMLLPCKQYKWAGISIEILIFILFLISVISIAGYLLKMEFLYTWYNYKRMLFTTAFSLLCISIGLGGVWRSSPWSIALYHGREDTRIILLSSAILLCMALAITLANFASLFKQQTDAIGQSFQQLQKSRSNFFQNEIARNLAEMNILRTNTLLQEEIIKSNKQVQNEDQTPSSNFQSILRLFAAEGFTGVAVYNDNNKKIAAMGTFNQVANFNIKEKIDSGFLNILWKNGWFLQIATLITEKDKKIGLLVVEIPLLNIDKVFAANQMMGKTGDINICMPADAAQTKALCYSARFNTIKMLPVQLDNQFLPVHYGLLGKSGLTTDYDPDYQRVLVAYGPIGVLGLAMLVKMEIAEIYQPIIKSLYSMVPVIVFAIVIGLILLRLQVIPLIRRVINAEKGLLSSNKRLQESEERYALAVRGSNTGLWDWNIAEDTVFYSPYFKGMLGYSDIEFANTIDAFKKNLHPDDYDRVFDLVQQHIASQVPYDIEYRLKRKSGDYHWYHAVGQALWDDEGNALRMAGSLMDVTERKRAEQRLAAQYAIIRILSEASNLEEVAVKILQALCERLEWEFGALWMVDNQINLIRCVGIWEQPFLNADLLVEALAHLECPMGVDMPGRVWETAQQLWVFDVASDKNFQQVDQAKAAGLHSAFCFPIMLQNKVLGVLQFFTRQRQTPDEALLKMMAAITTQMGQFIQRKLAESGLRENENYKTAILEFASDSIMTINEQGTILSYNPRTAEIFDYSEAALKNKNIDILVPDLSPKLNVLVGKLASEFIAVRSNGDTFVAELALSKMYLSKQNVFVCIIRDITERKKIEKLKNEFVSVVSHELRTPLTSIRGALGLMLGGGVGEFSQKSHKLLEIANSNCERLLLLINDILDIEKIEAGKMDFEFKYVDLQKSLQEAVEINKMYADKYKVTLRITQSEPGMMIYVDPARLMQVLSNLISNAIKFSRPQGKVDLAMAQHGDVIRVSVTDYGVGVAEKFRVNIFQKFSQADASAARDVGGTGLGLSICKAIVERFGGSINFTSKPNEETIFYFDLPKAKPKNKINDKKTAKIPDVQRILICEDDKEQAQYVESLLYSAGYLVDIASSVAEAKEYLLENRYEAILLDLLLPDQDGIAFIRQLREEERTRNLPIIVISIVAQMGRSLLNGNAFSVLDWLDKPVDFNKLLASIERLKKVNPKKIPHILHIEDNADTRQVIGTLLQEHVSITEVDTLEKARAELEKNSFDLVLLDLLLPDGNGAELLPLLAELKLPVVVFSSMELDSEYSHYVKDALVKSPSSTDNLLLTIKNLIKSVP